MLPVARGKGLFRGAGAAKTTVTDNAEVIKEVPESVSQAGGNPA